MLIISACLVVAVAVMFIVYTAIQALKNKVPEHKNFDENDLWLAEIFRSGNVIVDGKKGKGKDVLFAHAIALRNEPHYANIFYDDNTEVRSISSLELGDLTFEELIDDDYDLVDDTFERGQDFYISDGGIYLPSQYDKELNEKYRSLPIRYALSRQLSDMNIHVNVQNIERLWKKLREQADSFLRVLRKKVFKDHIVLEVVYFDEYRSIVAGLRPLRSKNKEKVADFEARHGIIERRTIKVYFKDLQFDTYEFRKKLLKNSAEPDEKYLIEEANYVE